MCNLCGDTPLTISHAHVHSDASRIDGLGTVDRLITAASDAGMHHLALTDHGTLANAIAFTATAKAKGVKPIIGMEAYVHADAQTFHLTILADGNRGLNTLIQLNNAGQLGVFSKPAFHIDLLSKYNDGLTVLSGCPASPLQATDWSDARAFGLKLKGIFGDRFMAEFMFVSTGHPWERAAKLSRDLRLHPIVTNDVHFPFRTDAETHKILVRLKAAFAYESDNLFLASAHEILARARDWAPDLLETTRRGIRNSYRLLAKLASPVWTSQPQLPYVENADASVYEIAQSRLVALSWDNPSFDLEIYAKRLEYEYQVVKEMGFLTYFYILHDLVTFARNNDVRVGPGRGSGAGSLLLYLLQITDIDPIKYDLQFERFLNPKRKEMPDVDVDFDSDGRESVIKYAAERWGGMPVATYSRYSDKVLIADLARFFRVPRPISQEASDGGTESDAFKRIAVLHPPFEPAFNAMLGQIRHIGQHAGGIIITDVPVPIERTSKGGTVAGWTEGMNSRDLTTAGIVKFDLLGLTALGVLKTLEDKHERKAPPPPDGDSEVFSLFREGDTVGIFQFAGSSGIVDFTKKIYPNRFADLVAINALYRPGALDSGAAENYPAWRHNPRLLHPLVDPILASTYGVICYQEQFMAIFAKITKGDLGDADLARKVIVKSKPGDPVWENKMAQLHVDFIRGGESQGVNRETLEVIWHEIGTHARYSFNLSHAVAYAYLAWELAWWKFYHPADFYAATLSSDPEDAQKYLFDVVGRGIKIVAPHINHSTRGYESDGEKVYLPLTAIKGLGDRGVEAILAARPFTSLEDFIARVPARAVNSRARLGLYELGAMKDVTGRVESLKMKPSLAVTNAERQRAYLGYVLPTVKIVRAIKEAEAEGWIAGIVDSSEFRSSQYGEYVVYRLVPHGTCWSRNHTDIPVGAFVKLRVKENSGKIIEFAKLL